jgi:hypothetical protein
VSICERLGDLTYVGRVHNKSAKNFVKVVASRGKCQTYMTASTPVQYFSHIERKRGCPIVRLAISLGQRDGLRTSYVPDLHSDITLPDLAEVE